MKRIVVFLVIMAMPFAVCAEIKRIVVERYPALTKGDVVLPGLPKVVTYVDSEGKELAREFYDENGSITKTTGRIPDGMVKEYFASGGLLAEYNYKNGKLEGLSKGYYEHGGLRGEWNYREGKLEGIVRSYYENGALNYEVPYSNNEMNGVGRFFDDKGVLFYEPTFLDGKLHGVVKEYYENGRLKSETEYAMGAKDGVKKEYYPNGKMRCEERYKKNERISRKEYDQEGKPISEQDFLPQQEGGS